MTRIAIFGDVGGHHHPFADQLSALGCNPDAGTVPDGLVVIQAGDLVHRGPDSGACIRMVDRFLANSDGRYIQMLGNHEGHELGWFQMEGFEDDVSPIDTEIIWRWWFSRQARIAVAIDVEGLGEMLVVHGGVSPWLWDALGGRDAAETATIINSVVGGDGAAVFQPGILLGYTNAPPGPVWAEGVSEVYAPWMRVGDAPFGQVHGHTTPFAWGDNWRDFVPDEIRATATHFDEKNRHLWLEIAGKPFIAIDPGHGYRPAPQWGPLILEGTVAA